LHVSAPAGGSADERLVTVRAGFIEDYRQDRAERREITELRPMLTFLGPALAKYEVGLPLLNTSES